MTDDYADRFFVLCLAGIGMTLAGGLCLPFARSAGWRRAAAAGLAGAVGAAAAGAGVWALTDGNARLARDAAGLVAAGVFVCLAAGPALAVGRRAAVLVDRPAVRWGLLTAAGLAVVAASAVQYDLADDARTQEDMADLALEGDRPPLTEATEARVFTDRGTALTVQRPVAPRPTDATAGTENVYLQRHSHATRLIRRQPANDLSNCHGWTFTGGRFWVPGSLVETILADNAYAPAAAPRPGDVAVYRKDGQVAHTAIVRYVSDGMPVLVEGKWGSLGVYLHPAGECPYGAEVHYYRSPRRGHLLAGLGEPTATY